MYLTVTIDIKTLSPQTILKSIRFEFHRVNSMISDILKGKSSQQLAPPRSFERKRHLLSLSPQMVSAAFHKSFLAFPMYDVIYHCYVNSYISVIKEERNGETVDRPPKHQTTNLVELFWLPAGCWIP